LRCPDGTDLDGHLLKAGTDTDEVCNTELVPPPIKIYFFYIFHRLT